MTKLIFYKTFDNFPLSNNPFLNLVEVSSEGFNSRELLNNIRITVEDSHGNSGPDLSFDDLSKNDRAKILNLITSKKVSA